MFESHVQELLIAMNDKKHDKLSEVSLQALAALSKADPNLVSGDKWVLLMVDSAQAQENGRSSHRNSLSRYGETSQICGKTGGIFFAEGTVRRAHRRA